MGVWDSKFQSDLCPSFKEIYRFHSGWHQEVRGIFSLELKEIIREVHNCFQSLNFEFSTDGNVVSNTNVMSPSGNSAVCTLSAGHVFATSINRVQSNPRPSFGERRQQPPFLTVVKSP